MNGFCTTQIDQVFFVVHLSTKVIPTKINILQHLYFYVCLDKPICMANCRYQENMRIEMRSVKVVNPAYLKIM